MGKHRRKRRRGAAADPSYTALLVLVGAALILLVPLRSLVLSVAPPVALLAALVLFVTPGAVMVGLARIESDVLARIPVAFALSAGLFGLLALPFLVLKWSLASYTLACGIVLLLSILALAWLMVRGTSHWEERDDRGDGTPVAGRLLWVPFTGLAAVAATISVFDYHLPGSDTWSYLMHIQDFMGTGRLNEDVSGLSRTTVAGWMLELSALFRVSGVDPVDAVLTYLEPALIAVAFLAFYGLARTLFESKLAALLSGCLAALLFLLQLNPNSPVPKGEFVGHLTEDKYVAQYVFLPVALTLAALFLKERRWRHLILYIFLCVSVLAIHYIGFVLICISVAGLGLMHLIANRRDRGAWKAVGALWGVFLALGLPPTAYLLTIGRAYLPRPDAGTFPEEALAYSTLLGQERLLELGDGTYIAHPSLMLNPVMLAVYLVGVPLLLWRLRRDGPAAQVPLGILLLLPLLVYVPPVTALIGAAAFPRLIARLIWLFPLAAWLTLGWTAWQALRYLVTRHGGIARPVVVPLLSLVLVGILALASAAPIWLGVRATVARGEIPQEESTCLDPTFRWMQGVVTAPSVVLTAPNKESTCLPAYSGEASVIVYRALLESKDGEGQPFEPLSDVQSFLNAPVVDEEMLEMLHRYYVSYVLLPQDSPLNLQLAHLQGSTPLDNPGERYRVYRVDHETLLELAGTPPIEMNGHLNRGDPQDALPLLDAALEGNKDERFLARLAAGRAYTDLNEPGAAVEEYEQALRLFPDSPEVYPLLADAHVAMEEFHSAVSVLEEAVALYPEDVDLRYRFSALLLALGEEKEALKHYRKVVEMFPNVPEYRVTLGYALAQAGNLAAADKEVERALDLNPTSPTTYGYVAKGYERASEIEPEQVFLELGYTYYIYHKRSAAEEGYAELSEKYLRLAAEPRETGSRDKLRMRAYFFLGNLYRGQDRTEEAIAAYEEALEIDPDFKGARRNLERLRRDR